MAAESVTCDIPKEALEQARKIVKDIPATIDAVLIYLIDGNRIKRIIDCPYYRPMGTIDGKGVYGCLVLKVPEDLTTAPENLREILDGGYGGCPCKYDKGLPEICEEKEDDEIRDVTGNH